MTNYSCCYTDDDEDEADRLREQRLHQIIGDMKKRPEFAKDLRNIQEVIMQSKKQDEKLEQKLMNLKKKRHLRNELEALRSMNNMYQATAQQPSPRPRSASQSQTKMDHNQCREWLQKNVPAMIKQQNRLPQHLTDQLMKQATQNKVADLMNEFSLNKMLKMTLDVESLSAIALLLMSQQLGGALVRVNPFRN
ncbi:hypothetical protein Ciccas_007725 [Cichlidogyrus casuarinus]|uniref:Uncharacterized protein n=1 Tax=Cichlidogyrus casuarinus TaxID=1844966 RepID=A0ABD2Q222_9PLAT